MKVVGGEVAERIQSALSEYQTKQFNSTKLEPKFEKNEGYEAPISTEAFNSTIHYEYTQV
jgi:hypothetical protein